MRNVGRFRGWVLAVIASAGFRVSALELRIVDVTAERPLSGVQVEWSVDGGTNRIAVSGSEGRVQIPVDSGSATGLRLGVGKPGHVSMIMAWPAGRVPDRFDWRLPESQRIGGTVVDGEDRPIAGARVSLRIPRRLAGPHVIPEGLVVMTGADGKWVCSQVPANAAYVKVEVSHPDFLSPEAEEPAESALRAMSWISRVVRDSERGGRLDFALEPMPAPTIPVPEPTAENRLEMGARWEPERPGSGERATLFVRIRLAPGFHVYALEDSGGSNLPTALEGDWPQLKTEGPWRGPPPRVDATGARIYAGEVSFRRDFVVADGTNPGPMKVPLSVSYQVCNEAFCWPPTKVHLETVLQVARSDR